MVGTYVCGGPAYSLSCLRDPVDLVLTTLRFNQQRVPGWFASDAASGPESIVYRVDSLTAV